MSSPRIIRHESGKPLNIDTKLVIFNVLNKFRKKYPDHTMKNIVELTSEFSGVLKSNTISIKFVRIIYRQVRSLS